MIRGSLARRAEELVAARVAFVEATVVRAQRPTSVHAGDAALVLADGTMEGFVGGTCAQASVRLHAARALETGEPLLLRLVPEGAEAGTVPEGAEAGTLPEGAEAGTLPAGAEAGTVPAARDDAVVVHNPCLSGGSIEIFLEPQLPAPRVIVVGDAPIARALEELARAARYDVVRADAGDVQPDPSDAALIVASHGGEEEPALARALDAGVGYVALVASEVRGAAVRAALAVPDGIRGQLHTPAGLDIGARSPADVAISILAELVATRNARPEAEALGGAAHSATATSATAIDPVCGMEVAAAAATPHLDVEGERLYFCCDGCRTTYASRHAADVAGR
jgi:xanthine dehydrogenase accessory factor